jgi:hypothetical protein
MRDEQQKTPDLWMIKARFVGPKAATNGTTPAKETRARKALEEPSDRGSGPEWPELVK